MPDPLPACFGGGATGFQPESMSAAPTTVTSVYETPLGVASLTWSRTVLGLLVRVALRIDDESDSDSVSFKIRPWLLWKRRGVKKLHVGDRSVDVSWDLSRARFAASSAPEPVSGYSLSVSVDDEAFLDVGKSPAISRRERMAAAGKEERFSYSSRASFRGKERSISIDVERKEMRISVEGKRIVEVRRLQWKFRGSDRVELGGGDAVLVSWDLHDWLFPAKESSNSSSSEEQPMFVFRFENEEEEEGHFRKQLSDSGEKKKRRKKEKKSTENTTTSSSSSSSASSTGSSTVTEWTSQEEAELGGRRRGFSLLLYASKS
ncbi:uncharacterized protein M6B38_408640 [Iris pallida]|uniref:Uncharacterized protein n=1 Tax=Iris pallida TaxID=29817 RepID=A0AAX6FQU6_IRIPA|nr:uncharacterized protein M6B38_408640 [Iris pallida]